MSFKPARAVPQMLMFSITTGNVHWQLPLKRLYLIKASGMASYKTLITKTDTCKWIHLEVLKAYVKTSKDKLQAILTQQTDADWEDSISTKEFGTKTKVEAFGRIISHTTYHAGQMAIILKYGNV